MVQVSRLRLFKFTIFFWALVILLHPILESLSEHPINPMLSVSVGGFVLIVSIGNLGNPIDMFSVMLWLLLGGN